MMRVKYSVLLIAVLILSGCSNLQWPPPGETGGRAAERSTRPVQTTTTPASQRADIPASGIIQVKNGDTLFILSRRYGVSARAIIEANDLTPPYRLQRGESLILPRPRIHQIARGDSLYKISRRYGVDAYELARLNHLQPPYRIYVGQKLVLPSSGASDMPEDTAVAKREPGETESLPSVKVDAAAIPDIPAPSRKPSTKTSPAKSRSSKTASKALKTIAVPRVKTSGRFNWPVRGRLLSVYGSKGEGLHNDGINIVAPKGASVRAAGSGVVAYAGYELRGFGNLLLIKHKGGWVTAYAHNERLLVRRGDKVGSGQVIAKVGASGNVIRPQLHFEIRKGKRALNPLRHLKRLSASHQTSQIFALLVE
ncbi:MAG: peptidoglycan DD-metalloendopeptidase family protein [Rhodospirillaceae bacterium]|nr:peptidoglycan DD-metalloendopeptidase family protein [Rhodospirillaceae bacterium]